MSCFLSAHPRRRVRPGGFTLIELLVVVAIIALLVAILLPALGNAKEMTRQGICMTNQRLIQGALMAYQSSNRYFPYNYYTKEIYGGSGQDLWALGVLNEYMGGEKGVLDLTGKYEGEFPAAYICPSADKNAVFGGGNSSNPAYACYYTNNAIRINFGWGTWLCNNAERTSSPPVIDDAGTGGYCRTYGQSCKGTGYYHWVTVYHPTLESIPDPSTVVFTGDTNDKSYIGYQAYEDMPGEWKLRVGWGHVAGSLGFPNLDRHHGRMMLGYMDGHGGPFMKADFNKYSWFGGPTEPSGDLLTQYPPSFGCGGTRIHRVAPEVVH